MDATNNRLTDEFRELRREIRKLKAVTVPLTEMFEALNSLNSDL